MITASAPTSIIPPKPTRSIALSVFSAIRKPIIPKMICSADTATIIIAYVLALPTHSLIGAYAASLLDTVSPLPALCCEFASFCISLSVSDVLLAFEYAIIPIISVTIPHNSRKMPVSFNILLPSCPILLPLRDLIFGVFKTIEIYTLILYHSRLYFSTICLT